MKKLKKRCVKVIFGPKKKPEEIPKMAFTQAFCFQVIICLHTALLAKYLKIWSLFFFYSKIILSATWLQGGTVGLAGLTRLTSCAFPPCLLGASTTVFRIMRVTFFIINRLEHKKLYLEFLVFNLDFSRWKWRISA